MQSTILKILLVTICMHDVISSSLVVLFMYTGTAGVVFNIYFLDVVVLLLALQEETLFAPHNYHPLNYENRTLSDFTVGFRMKYWI